MVPFDSCFGVLKYFQCQVICSAFASHNYKQEHNILHVMETCINCLTKVNFLNVNFTGFFALFMVLTETLKKAIMFLKFTKPINTV